MIKKLELTNEHIKLIPFFFLQEEGDNKIFVDRTNMYNLGSHLLEDMAMILGYNDSAISGTEENENGRAFPDEIEKHMLDLHKYIVDNLYYIESLIHQYVVKGGIKEGVYKCKDNELIWEN